MWPVIVVLSTTLVYITLYNVFSHDCFLSMRWAVAIVISNYAICSLVRKNYNGADVTINTVTPHYMDKLFIQKVVDPHHMDVNREAMPISGQHTQLHSRQDEATPPVVGVQKLDQGHGALQNMLSY